MKRIKKKFDQIRNIYHIGEDYEFRMRKIVISDDFLAHAPRNKKMIERIDYFLRNGKFHSPILLDAKSHVLLDGYTSYLIAKTLGWRKVPVQMM